MSTVRELSVEEAISRLNTMLENEEKIKELRTQGNIAVSRAKATKVELPPDTKKSNKGKLIFAGVVVSWIVAMSFNVPLIAIVATIAGVVFALKSSVPTQEEEQLEAEYEQRVQAAEMERKQLENQVLQIQRTNKELIYMESRICQTVEGYKMMRMFLESGQANSTEMAYFMTEKELLQRKQQKDMQNQINSLKKDVWQAEQRAAAAEEAAANAESIARSYGPF